MSEFKGLAAHAAGAHLLPYKYDPGKLSGTDVEVKISHCGICHSDVHLIDNDWGISKYPFIPGHEIVGTVTAVGSSVTRPSSPASASASAGRQTPAASASGAARAKSISAPNPSPPASAATAATPTPSASTPASPSPSPPSLESENVAPLLCGGITVYAPLRNHWLRPSSRVGVIGIGGLGHMGLQFARAFGAEVTAFSTSKDKEEEARKLGAHHFVNTRDTGAMKKVASQLRLPPHHRHRQIRTFRPTSTPSAPKEPSASSASLPARSRCRPSASSPASAPSPAAPPAAPTIYPRCSTSPPATTSKPSPSASPWTRPTKP